MGVKHRYTWRNFSETQGQKQFQTTVRYSGLYKTFVSSRFGNLQTHLKEKDLQKFHKIQKQIEFLSLYLIMPILLAVFSPSKRIAIPVLLIATGPTILLIKSKSNAHKTPVFFQNEKPESVGKYLAIIFTRFAITSAILWFLLAQINPDIVFNLPKRSWTRWMFIMLAYPLFSVVPQVLIYRVLFVKRYSELFANKTVMLLVGTTIFSLAHLMFKSIVILSFTFAGGFIFLRSYQKNQSIWINILEHSLYGNMLFTLGWGRYFFQ